MKPAGAARDQNGTREMGTTCDKAKKAREREKIGYKLIKKRENTYKEERNNQEKTIRNETNEEMK